MPHKTPRRFSAACLMCFILCPWNALPAQAQAPEPLIIIEEVAWAGSSLSIADEWIELANLGDATTTIGGWSLHGAGTSDRVIYFPLDASIPPHGVYLISNYPKTDASSAINVDVQLATTTIGLSNSALGIELDDASGAMIDRAGNGSSPFAGSTKPFASMIRASSTMSGDQKDAWTSATSSVGFKEGVSDFGNPGVCDLCSVAVAVPEMGVSSTTSTPDVQGEISVTSTDAVMSEASTSTDATTSTAQEISETSSDVIDPMEMPDAMPPMPISLNEIVSNPSSGHEWVELFIENDATSTDRAFFLYDSQSKIATIATGTVMTLPHFLVFSLPTSKLNNDGDNLSLKEANGSLIESATIPALEKDEAWEKVADGEWRITTTPTPGSDNVLTDRVAPPSSTVVQNITTVTAATSQSSPAQVSHADIFLNEVVSNPETGNEWVELYVPVTAATTDRDLFLYDAKSKIATIKSGSILASGHYLVTTFSSAKLNNSGEHLSLREADGTVIDETDISALKKGEAWARGKEDGWAVTRSLTPGAGNVIKKEREARSEERVSTSTSDIVSMNVQTKEAATKKATTPSPSAKATGDKAKKTTAKASASKIKTTAAIHSYSFSDMFDSSLNTARVSVSGTAGTPDRFLGATHAFILLNEDGRGLIVYLPKHLNVPRMGSTVNVQGTLSSTYRGPELHMKTTDVWMTMGTSTEPQPRSVDLLLPGAEDAWSLVSVEGVVNVVGASSVSITTDDGIDVTISVPTVVDFRAKRLRKNDRIRITGLLDIRKNVPTILPRSGDDVSILAYAPQTVTDMASSTVRSASAPNALPGWTPYASAAGAIGATVGGKKIRNIWRKRKLKRIMAMGKGANTQ